MSELLDAESPEVRPPQGPAEDAIDIILKSRSFERATASRQLLAYLWAHRKEELSEYTLAVEALGRRPDFDPRIDATVRVQVSRLRQRLHEFSQCYEAKLCTVELAIPVGTHQLQVVERPVAEPSAANHAADAVAGAAGQSAGHLRYLFASVTACVLIAMGTVAYLQLRGAGRQVVEAHTPQSQFWSAFLGPGKITRILLPTPIFFAVDDAKQQLRVRDLSVNDYSDWTKSEALKQLAGKSPGHLEAETSYMVASDTFAAISLARYLDRSASSSEVQFGTSSSASMDDLDHENEIVLGSYFTLHPFAAYLSQLSFQMEPFERGVDNSRALPGEPSRLEEKVVETGHRSTQPGIIAILPGRTPGFHLMILQARHTSALVSFLTSSAGAEELQELCKKKGSPASYEVVVYSEMIDDHPVRTWPVLLHPIPLAK